MVEYSATNMLYSAGWSRSLGMPFGGIRKRNTSKSVCASLMYRNWVRKGNDSGFGNVSGTIGTLNEDSEFVSGSPDASSMGRLAQ